VGIKIFGRERRALGGVFCFCFFPIIHGKNLLALARDATARGSISAGLDWDSVSEPLGGDSAIFRFRASYSQAFIRDSAARNYGRAGGEVPSDWRESAKSLTLCAASSHVALGGPLLRSKDRSRQPSPAPGWPAIRWPSLRPPPWAGPHGCTRTENPGPCEPSNVPIPVFLADTPPHHSEQTGPSDSLSQVFSQPRFRTIPSPTRHAPLRKPFAQRTCVPRNSPTAL